MVRVSWAVISGRALAGLVAVAGTGLALAGPPAGGSEPPEAAAAPKFRGYVSLFGDPVRNASQGAGWTLSFRERAPGRVRYKACLKHIDPPRVSRCWRARSPASGRRQDLFVARYVNDTGGPGRWRARWFVRGARVGQWRFRVRPERVGD